MGTLLAGAAMRSITPSLERLKRLGDEGAPGPVFTGVHEDIFVRAIVLSDGDRRVVLGTVDLIIFPAQQLLCDRLVAEYGIDPMGCIFACTHNHESPFMMLSEGDDESAIKTTLGAPTPELEAYTLFVHDMMAQAVAEAIAELEPARMGVNKGLSYINANRDLPSPLGGIQANNFHGPSDHELILLRFESLEGEPIGMFISHATHSNYMIWNLIDGSYARIGADLGGGISRFVEKANRNKFPVLWAIAAAGDQNPITRSRLRSIDVDDEGCFSIKDSVLPFGQNLVQMQSLVATQGLEVLELDRTMTDFTDNFSFAGAETYRVVPSRKSYAALGILPLCGERPEPVPNEKPLRLRFRLAVLNGVAFAGVNGEFYARLGMMVKKFLPCTAVVMVEMAYGHQGYLPDAETEKVNGFGTMNSFARSGTDSESAFMGAFRELKGKLGLAG